MSEIGDDIMGLLSDIRENPDQVLDYTEEELKK